MSLLLSIVREISQEKVVNLFRPVETRFFSAEVAAQATATAHSTTKQATVEAWSF